MKIHRSLFYLLLVLLPTQLTKYFFPEFAFVSGIRVDYLAPVIYATDSIVIGIFLTWIWDKLKTKQKHFSKNTALIIGICLVGIVLNILFAINPTIALLKWVRILEASFLCFYIAIEKPPIKTSSLFLIIGGLYSCVLAWVQFIQQSSVGGIFWWIGERMFTVTTPGVARTTFENKLFLRPYATFPHPNVLAGFLTCLIPLIFYVKKSLQLFFLPVLILFLATVFITFSQSAWIIATVTTFIFILIEKGVQLRKPAVLIGFLTLLTILSLVSYEFVEKESIARRFALNSTAFSIIKENPLGVGLNNFIVANDQQTINSYQDLQPVHSIYLLFVSETGIVGVLLLLLLLSFYKKIRINSISIYYIWSLGALLVFGLFDHYPLTIHQTLLLSGILTGFIFLASQSVINLKHGKRSK